MFLAKDDLPQSKAVEAAAMAMETPYLQHFDYQKAFDTVPHHRLIKKFR